MMIVIKPSRLSPTGWVVVLPPACWLVLAALVLQTARSLFAMGLIGRGGMLAMLRSTHWLSQAALQTWRRRRR